MRALIVPAAKLVGADLQVAYGPVPPVLVPVKGVPLLESLRARYDDLVDIIYVLVDEGADQVVRYLDFFPQPKIELVWVDAGSSLADSLNGFVAQRPEIMSAESVIINLGDTLVSGIDATLTGRDFVSCAHTSESARWTLFRPFEGPPWEISDKRYQEDVSSWTTFVGVWGLSEFSAFVDLLGSVAAREGVQPFYAALNRYFEAHAPLIVMADHWVDYGHSDNLSLARRESMNVRSFNSMSFERGGSSIKKRSRNEPKLIDEIEWVLDQPDSIRSFVPTVYSYKLEQPEPWVEMEYYPYPSLDEHLVFAQHDLDVWERIFRRIFEVLDLLSEERLVADDLREDLVAMYVEKPRQRIEELLGAYLLDVPTDADLVINGVECPSLEEALSLLPRQLEAVGALESPSFGRLHGDLCFGNILYDTWHHVLKMIDPRGRFGRHQQFGDRYYDLAKLSHSVSGKYDFIVFDQFKVDRHSATTYDLQFRTRPDHDVIAYLFERNLAARSLDAGRVHLIESTLFLSMIPLHATRPDHQQAMLLRGLWLLGRAMTS